jgi:hypothetical protein
MLRGQSGKEFRETLHRMSSSISCQVRTAPRQIGSHVGEFASTAFAFDLCFNWGHCTRRIE